MQDNLFTILDCYETLRDASRRKVTIVIRQLQEGDESRRREIVRHLGMYHLQAEPIIGALGKNWLNLNMQVHLKKCMPNFENQNIFLT